MTRLRTVGYSILFAIITAHSAVATGLPERTSSVNERESVNLTIYNGGSALVHDRRRVRLTLGVNRIDWRDVSANMDPTSALLETIGAAPANVAVLEQNFNFDLLDPSALLQKYVGKDVTIVHPAEFSGQRETRERARILSTNGGIVLQYANRIETSLRGFILYPASPKNFRDRPTLELDVESGYPGVRTLDLSYLTSGLDWHADYVGNLSDDETRLDVTGLVTLSNTSGVAYDNARLQLVAGNVNIARGTPAPLKTIARITSNVYSVAAPRPAPDHDSRQTDETARAPLRSERSRA